MKFNLIKKATVSSLLIAAIGATYVFAATPVKQDAYYDTFTFKVNGNVQYISDATKKPFIANSRVYVPISTLNDLGISNVEWTPAGGGASATLNVSPAQSMDVAKEAYYETKIKQLADDIAKKDAEIKTLTDENKKLKEAESKSTKSEKTSKKIDDLKSLARDISRDLNRDRNYNTIRIDGSSFDVEYDLYYGGRSLEITMYIMNMKSGDIDNLKKSYYRDFERLLEDVVYEVDRNKDFKDEDKYITVYSGRSNSTKLADYETRGDRGLRGDFVR